MKGRRRKRRDHQPFLTVEELRRLLAVCGVRNRALFLAVYECALRRHEPGLLRLADWDGAAGQLFVHRGKGSIDGSVDASEPLAQALCAWTKVRPRASEWLFPGRNGRGLSGEAVAAAFKTACRRAGLPKRSAYPHILKHSRITHLVDEDADPKYAQHVAGQVSLANTMRYWHLTPAMRRAGEEATARTMASLAAPSKS